MMSVLISPIIIMSRDIVPKLSTKEKEQLRNKGYKFHVEHELPKILIPWSR